MLDHFQMIVVSILLIYSFQNYNQLSFNFAKQFSKQWFRLQWNLNLNRKKKLEYNGLWLLFFLSSLFYYRSFLFSSLLRFKSDCESTLAITVHQNNKENCRRQFHIAHFKFKYLKWRQKKKRRTKRKKKKTN